MPEVVIPYQYLHNCKSTDKSDGITSFEVIIASVFRYDFKIQISLQYLKKSRVLDSWFSLDIETVLCIIHQLN